MATRKHNPSDQYQQLRMIAPGVVPICQAMNVGHEPDLQMARVEIDRARAVLQTYIASLEDHEDRARDVMYTVDAILLDVRNVVEHCELAEVAHG